YDRSAKTMRELLPDWDRNADAYIWAPDMSALYVQTTDAGRDKLYRVALDKGTSALKASAPKLLIGDHNNTAFALSHDGNSIAWVRDATEAPAEVQSANISAAGVAVPHVGTPGAAPLVAQPAVQPA